MRILGIEIEAGPTTCHNAESKQTCRLMLERGDWWRPSWECCLWNQELVNEHGVPSGPGLLQRLPQCLAAQAIAPRMPRQKCATNRGDGATIAMLIPASVGSGYFAEWIRGKATILYPRPRLTFIGHDAPYPKDLALCVYSDRMAPGEYSWNWREVAPRLQRR
jgi:hypothetical protein